MSGHRVSISATEKDIMQVIFEYLCRRNHFPVRDKQQTKNQKLPFPESKGVADIMCMVKGKPIHFIEVKTPSGVLSIEQQKFLAKATEYGAIAFVATCLDDVRAKGL